MVSSVPTTLSRPAVLVVDDKTELLAATQEWLASDFEVSSASTAAEALRTWAADPRLRVAVVDLKLPDEHGEEKIEVGLQLISELAQRPGATVVVRSAFDEEENRREAQARGARRFLSKGRRAEPLLECLRELTADEGQSRPPSFAEPLAPLTEPMRRQLHDHAWALGQIDLLRQYAGQIVGVFGEKVWGHGPDLGAAIANASQTLAEKQEQPGTPSLDDLTFMVIPDRTRPEPPLPSY